MNFFFLYTYSHFEPVTSVVFNAFQNQIVVRPINMVIAVNTVSACNANIRVYLYICTCYHACNCPCSLAPAQASPRRVVEVPLQPDWCGEGRGLGQHGDSCHRVPTLPEGPGGGTGALRGRWPGALTGECRRSSVIRNFRQH